MTLWEYLKSNMREYGEKKALICGNETITYNELIRLAETGFGEKRKTGRNIVPVYESDKLLYAVRLLSILKQNDIAVPLSREYGNIYCENVFKELKANRDFHIDGNIALIMFTSGSCGRPKGVMLSHENVISNIKAIAGYFAVNSDDKILIARPLMHAAVLTGEFFVSLIKGLTIEFYPESFNPARLFKHIQNAKISVLCGTPSMWNLMCRAIRSGEKAGLKKISISGECLSPDIARQLTDKLPETQKYSVYGLTEASPRVSYLNPELFALKPGSIGKPLSGIEMKIEYDINCGNSKKNAGRLFVKSTGIMRGYYGMPELTNQKIINGWLDTGDMAYEDGDGCYYITGRADNMIIRAGMNIYPEEIEAALKEDENIEEVVCFGIPDPIAGKTICLKVKGDISESYVRQLAKAKLPPHMLPGKIEIVKEIEKTAGGKNKRSL